MSIVINGTANEVIVNGTTLSSTELAALDGTTGNIQTDKQNTLTSGTTIKTINGANVLASGDIAVSRLVSGATQATTTGTLKDFTGIPSWVKKITVMFDGVSTNGTSNLLVQLGDSDGIENTVYSSLTAYAGGTNNTSSSTSTIGFIISSGAASNILSGTLEINNIANNTYVSKHTFGVTNSNVAIFGGGSKTLSGTLDRIRITTVNGTDTFDAGQINIMYEG